MVQGFFYNSIDGDRKYNAGSMNESKRPFYKDGVFAGHLEVTAGGEEMAVIVDGGEYTGFAWVNAHTIHNTTPLKLDISQASGTLDRIDRVVLRNDETERKPSIYVLEGRFSPNPTVPELTNTATIQERCLAEIYIHAGAVVITQADITDTRADTNICGFVASQFEEFDFSQWQKQFNSYFEQMKESYGADYNEFADNYAQMTDAFKNEQEKEWNDWFQDKREKLSEDVAGNLQAQVDECKKSLSEHKETVGEVQITGYKSHDNDSIGDVPECPVNSTDSPRVGKGSTPLGWKEAIAIKEKEKLSSIIEKLTNIAYNVKWLFKWLNSINTIGEYTSVDDKGNIIKVKNSANDTETGMPLPFPIQTVVEGHERTLRQLNTDMQENVCASVTDIAIGNGTYLFWRNGNTINFFINSEDDSVSLSAGWNYNVFKINKYIPKQRLSFIGSGKRDILLIRMAIAPNGWVSIFSNVATVKEKIFITGCYPTELAIL